MKIKLLLFALSLGLTTFSCKSSAELTQKYEQSQQELENCKEQSQQYARKMESMEQESEDFRARMNVMQEEYSQMRNKLAQTEAALSSVTQELQVTSDDYGVWFRVQIGAYEDRQIDQDLETNEEGLGLENTDDMQKIVLGRFRDYAKARQLQMQVKSLGIQDAWIASYKDGVRVPIEQVIGN